MRYPEPDGPEQEAWNRLCSAIVEALPPGYPRNQNFARMTDGQIFWFARHRSVDPAAFGFSGPETLRYCIPNGFTEEMCAAFTPEEREYSSRRRFLEMSIDNRLRESRRTPLDRQRGHYAPSLLLVLVSEPWARVCELAREVGIDPDDPALSRGLV
jgi:hypothetical protein